MATLPTQHIIQLLTDGDAAGTSHRKGQALEQAVSEVFEAIPGLELTQRNAYNAAGSEEIDIVFFNNQSKKGLSFLPPIVVVECKNWSGHVTADEVSAFKSKLQTRKQDIGILVVANGLTGEWQPPTAAYDAIRTALHAGIQILVLTRAELSSATNTLQISELLKKRMVQLTAFETYKP